MTEALNSLLSLHLPDTTVNLANPTDFGLLSIESAKISRSVDYQLTLRVAGKFDTRAGFVGVSIPAGTVIKGADSPTFEGHVSPFAVTLIHCSRETSNHNFPTEIATIEFEPHEVRLENAQVFPPPSLTAIYFTSALSSGAVAWDTVLFYNEKSDGTFESVANERSSEAQIGWRATSMSVGPFKAFFGLVQREVAGNGNSCVLLVHGNVEDSRNFAWSFSRMMCLITGAELVPLGCKKFSHLNELQSGHYWSVHKDDIDRRGKAQPRPLLPVSWSDQPRQAVGITLTTLWDNYVSKNEIFDFDVLLWYLVESFYLPLDLWVHPLATAMDLLADAWFRSDLSPSKGKFAKDDTFAERISPLVLDIERALADIPNKDRILKKILSSNQMGHGARQTAFFEEVGIPLTDAEETLLGFRNKAIHGFRSGMDTQEKFLLAGGFHSLFGKAVLKLLGHDGTYRDYSSLDFPYRRMNEGLGFHRQGAAPPNPV